METEIAVPFVKQPGNTYPNLNMPSSIEPSCAHMSTETFTAALLVVRAVSKPRYTQPRSSRQPRKRKNAGISTTNHRDERKKARCRQGDNKTPDFHTTMAEIQNVRVNIGLSLTDLSGVITWMSVEGYARLTARAPSGGRIRPWRGRGWEESSK